MPIQAHFLVGILTRKVGQSGLVLVCNQASLVGLFMQDYKSMCPVVTILSSWLRSKHTDRRTAELTSVKQKKLKQQLLGIGNLKNSQKVREVNPIDGDYQLLTAVTLI